jgi:glycosyltransferase involved in cell wall biosynthesis
MRIAYVTTYDPHDRNQWSGLGYHVARALRQQHHTLEFIGSLHKVRPWNVLAKKVLYTARRQGYLADRDCAVVKGYAEQVARKLEHLDVDLVFSPGTIPIAYLETSRPIVVWTDSAFASMIDFYPDFSNLCDETLRSGDALEAAALARAALAIYSSDWAAQTARRFYDTPVEKLRIVPFGANIESTPTLEEVERMVSARSSQVCKLVFLGVDWYRKGGDVAVEVTRQLNASGIPASLVVVGTRPRLPEPYPSWLHYQGSIGKASSSRVAELTALLADAQFLLLPTRADCTPVTFGEANAFGVPCLSSCVGGVPSIVRTGVNGATFGLGEISGYCDFIARYFGNPACYRELAMSSYNEYATRLNWTAASQAVSDLLENVACST